MLVAVFADVHGHADALEAVLAAAERPAPSSSGRWAT